ncbi:hypothetical protein F511_12376 [Dorcoceras hygrometricum]|uniref:BAH domain-containing protein n=1 Tax=Dorcoceras hygrometricum TaxID=472368 RepID=A0A2Z7DK70_9LAMI|nr:hypothetical protein F511_12376 [Dorcoceras hygrometricum]
MGAVANDSTTSFVDWEEVVVSSDKGRREVHYYLKRNGGGADLVVVGKEKSVRHMSYHYAMKDNMALLSNLKRCSFLKLRSRREVIDWLNSIFTVDRADGSFGQFGDDLECKSDLHNVKDAKTQSLSRYRTEFMWIGSPWTCRKRRSHYASFCRNGVVISVQDFVYVLAEEGKRLVAYLDDMYEDSRGNKMVVVRWFHRIDEVGFVLPRNYNGREIFFSLCLQDLSVECVDGQATVLSPEHYERFMSKESHIGLEPFVCYRQFDNDDVKPFDVTIIKGYWKQELLKEISSPSVLEPIDEDREVRFSLGDDTVACRPNKRIRWSKESGIFSNPSNEGEHVENLKVPSGGSVDHEGNLKIDSRKEVCTHASLSKLDNDMVSHCGQNLAVGSEVELLSQDSGIRGCWFRALIIKKHKDKVKVQYQDVKDAVDDTKNLEEWILGSRLATPDVLGIRISGRAIVRPTPLPDERRVSSVLNVGSLVDAWWHDGWWEGIVVKCNSVNNLHVYFPGENKEQIFSVSDLRQSQEWIDNEWKKMEDMPEIISTLLERETFSSTEKDVDAKLEAGSSVKCDVSLPEDTNVLLKASEIGGPMTVHDIKMPNDLETIRDLSKDLLLTHLRWNSSCKRRRSRSPVHKLWYRANCDYSGMSFEKLFVNPSVKFDPDNCKYANDSHFNSSVVSPMTNLVMSR